MFFIEKQHHHAFSQNSHDVIYLCKKFAVNEKYVRKTSIEKLPSSLLYSYTRATRDNGAIIFISKKCLNN